MEAEASVIPSTFYQVQEFISYINSISKRHQKNHVEKSLIFH